MRQEVGILGRFVSVLRIDKLVGGGAYICTPPWDAIDQSHCFLLSNTTSSHIFSFSYFFFFLSCVFLGFCLLVYVWLTRGTCFLDTTPPPPSPPPPFPLLYRQGLWRVEIRENGLTGLRRDSLAGLERSLWELDLRDNKLSSIPTESLASLARLRVLDLSGEQSNIFHINWSSAIFIFYSLYSYLLARP